MLIINILLILLFFIILFYDRRIIEGQNVNDKYPMDYTIYDLYKTVVDSILNIKLNNDNINKYIFENEISCKNSENIILDLDNSVLNEYIKEISKSNKNNGNINNLFDIKISKSNSDNNIKEDNEINLCELVPMIYDENSSASLVSKITSTYGNCYNKELNNNLNIIYTYCQHDCSLIDYKINDCSTFQPININSCDDYKGDKNEIFLKKENGVYYNCEKNDDNVYKQKVCRPHDNILCNSKKTDLLSSCEENLNEDGKRKYDIDHRDYSSKIYNETILKINCQYDENDGKIKDVIDNNILHCENYIYGYNKYSGICY